MKIIINGLEKTLSAPLNISELLDNEGYADMTIAVARNGAFVPKTTYQDITLEAGDQIEIVAPMQGG